MPGQEGYVAILARPNLRAAASAILPQIPELASPVEAAAPAFSRSSAAGPIVRARTEARVSALYVAHAARIHRFLRDLLGDAVLAADATQETFARALKKLPEVGDREGDVGAGPEAADASLVPWLFGVARNVSLELRKARFRAAKHFSPIAADLDAAGPGSPETDYLGREAVRIVNAALEKLSEERRAMLLLRLDHGLSYDDIAGAMGCSLAKVKVEIFRARQVLREAMNESHEARTGRAR